ncbi:MAG: hypothetical protein JWM47_4039 [Acidimicrobiales bacterium]|nr:hypothetical protein [Acidimicrobiales bacterium]
MQSTRMLRSGACLKHVYEEMTREKRPQDIGRDGSTLRFTATEHHDSDACQESICIADRIGRCATYVAMDGFFEGVQTPQSDRLSGTDLTIETILHGVGEYDDDMPEALVVTHHHGRSSIYLPVTEDGKVVDSKFFEFGSASPIEAAR